MTANQKVYTHEGLLLRRGFRTWLSACGTVESSHVTIMRSSALYTWKWGITDALHPFFSSQMASKLQFKSL